MDLKTLEKINESVEFLPERFRKEFVEDVLVIDENLASAVVRKVLEYYLEEIFDELTQEEREKMFAVL